MDSRTRRRIATAGLWAIYAAVVAGTVFALTGCGATTGPTVRLKSKTELAVESISDELLQECEGLPPAPPNSVGDLLDDGTKAMGLLAECRLRQKRLADHIRPIVAAERSLPAPR